jgi:hypothetical protein
MGLIIPLTTGCWSMNDGRKVCGASSRDVEKYFEKMPMPKERKLEYNKKNYWQWMDNNCERISK